MKIIDYVLGALSVIAVFGSMLIGLTECNLRFSEHYKPKFANVERKTFKQTQSFNEGKAQDLMKYQLEYIQEKDPVAKLALKNHILMSFADYDRSKMSDVLQNFLYELERN